jgi:hypothetical protein
VSGLSIKSAAWDKGVVTIKLSGTLNTNYAYGTEGTETYPVTDPATNFKAKDDWIGASYTAPPEPAAGRYAAAYIGSLFKGVGDGKIIAVKQTNQAMRFFTGGLPASSPLDAAATSDEKAFYLPAIGTGDPVRWRVYNTDVIDDEETFGFLIWDANGTESVAARTATFEVQEWTNYQDGSSAVAGGYSAKVIVDYSEVNFSKAVFHSLLLSKPVWSNTDQLNKDNINEMLTRLWDTSAPSLVQGLPIGNVFTYAARTLTVNKANVTDGLKQWITTQWGGTSVPVKVTSSSGTPNSITPDANWDGAYLIWIDVATVTNATNVVIAGTSETYSIAVTP